MLGCAMLPKRGKQVGGMNLAWDRRRLAGTNGQRGAVGVRSPYDKNRPVLASGLIR